jgi:hypothetical protein
MNTHRRLALTALIGMPFLARPAFGAAPAATSIMRTVERMLDPAPSYRMVNTITQYQKGTQIDQIKIAVLTKLDNTNGVWRDIVQYMEPARDARKTVLNDGAALWFFDPGSRASLRISAQQRLLGQASNGDVVTINYGRDYHATLLGEATVGDANKVPKNCFHLELTPMTDAAVYGRLEYWIEKDTHFIIKGRCYADSGQLLKTVFYREQKPVIGGMRPMKAILIDAVDTSLVTTMSFSGFEATDIPDAWFQRAYLPRINAF